MKKIILLMIVVVGLFVGCAAPKEAPTPTPVEHVTPTPTPTPAPTPTPTPTVAAVVNCGDCHKRATEYVDHINGEQYCSRCHGTDPHVIHVGAGTIDLDCEVCHGGVEAIMIPEKGPGGTTCELCHAPDNPVKPSEGNLVNIHIPRGKYCTVCHDEPLVNYHKTADKGVQK
jgi:hypothetical protein